jgi:nicotinamidase-related amidase
MTKALFVIDVQDDFINPNSSLPGKLRSHIDSNDYDLLVISYYKNTTSTAYYKYLDYKDGLNNTREILVSELKSINKPHTAIEKTSYSIFKNIEIVPLLGQHNIDEIVFCGTDTDACVLASMFEAFDLGYKCDIVTDLIETSASDKTINQAALKIIKRNIVPTINVT